MKMKLSDPIWQTLKELDGTCRLVLNVGLLELSDEDRVRLPQLLAEEGVLIRAMLDQAEARLAELRKEWRADDPRDDVQ